MKKSTGKASTKPSKTKTTESKENTENSIKSTPIDDTPDNSTKQDSTEDVIMDNTTQDSNDANNSKSKATQDNTQAVEYDSDGNNLYDDEEASVSDRTKAASNESPNKRAKNNARRLAPIFENDKTIPESKTKTLFVAGIPVHKTKKALEEYQRAIKEFLKEISEYDNTAILYEMYENKPSVFEIKNWTNFPGKPSLVKKYLANCNPFAGEGMIWATFQLGLNECEESFIWVMKNSWGKNVGGFFKKKELQHTDTKQEIWFCLSHEDIDVEDLCKAQKNQFKFDTDEELHLSFRYSTVKDGNSGFYKQRAREQDDSLGTRRYVKAIIAETTTDQFDTYFDWVMKTYSRSSNAFPRGIRLRAVPIISKEYDTDTQEKIQALMQRQEHFQDSITSTYYLHVNNIDATFKQTGKTLREHLMSIPASDTNKQPLFISIGKRQWGKRKGDLLFTYPKKYAQKASRIVSNLNTYCYKTLGEPVLTQFFTARAKKSAMEAKWDENEGRAVSKTEQNLKEIMDEFDAMDYVENSKTAPQKQNGQTTMDRHAPPVQQIDAATQDDISSFGNSLLGGQRKAQARPSAFSTTFNPPDDTSVAQSVAQTVESLDSRMTAIENRLAALDRLEQFLDKFESKPTTSTNTTITASTPSQNSTNANNVVGDSAVTSDSGAPAH